jgi:tRNA threonylcarbamoyladenosine biosynthesis protein TsaB
LYAPDAVPVLPPGPWVGCGNAFAAYRDALGIAFGNRLRCVAAGVSVPHARAIAELAAVEVGRGNVRPAEQALPVYIRDKVALTIEEQH